MEDAYTLSIVTQLLPYSTWCFTQLTFTWSIYKCFCENYNKGILTIDSKNTVGSARNLDNVLSLNITQHSAWLPLRNEVTQTSLSISSTPTCIHLSILIDKQTEPTKDREYFFRWSCLCFSNISQVKQPVFTIPDTKPNLAYFILWEMMCYPSNM